MLGREGFDIYHLSFCLCRWAWAAESKLLRVIADTTCEGFPSNTVLRMSISRAVFTGPAGPTHCVTLRFPSKLFLCFFLHVFSFLSFFLKRETLELRWPPKGPRYGKVAVIYRDFACSFRTTGPEGWIFFLFLNGISELLDFFFIAVLRTL